MEKKGELFDDGNLVYVPDSKEGYALAELVDIGTDMMSVRIKDTGTVLQFPYEQVVAAEENQTKTVDDNCALMYLNEGTLLHNCKLRYLKKQIYTYVAHILIAINPYEPIPQLYSAEQIKQYFGKSLGALPPHIFAIADKAYREMCRLRQCQSIIVSGESGAGKTESQKAILRFLCHGLNMDSEQQIAGNVEKRILETNPILEAFGNAKTLRNNNSSRFGKFVEYHVSGAHVSHYLLEKTRVCGPQSNERNFHVFYQLFTNLDWIQRLSLDKSPDNFLEKKFGSIKDSMVDDVEDFERLLKALDDIGINGSLKNALFETLGGILHLGNVEFVENSDDTKGSLQLVFVLF